MGSIIVPHFNLPFRLDSATGHAQMVEQDSDEDVMNCVHAALRTERGSRLYVPNFGIEDPTFSRMPIDETEMISQIVESESRADPSMTQQIQEMVDAITIGVSVEVSSVGQ